MILFSVLATIALGVCICTALDYFYDCFAKWLKTLPKLLEKVIDGILIGCKTFIDTTKKKFGIAEELSKNYSKVGERWQVTTASREISLDEIPPELRERTFDDVLDVTDELDLSLKRS